MNTTNWTNVAAALSDFDISVVSDIAPRSVGGGDISAAWRLQTTDGPLFLKTTKASGFDMFEAEADGLSALANANAVRVPQVRALTPFDDGSLIALEWLELGEASMKISSAFGQQLADLHRRTQEQFGWNRDNYLGLTQQPNGCADNWLDFYREQRLEHQLRLAAENGYSNELGPAGQKLLDNLDAFFVDYVPAASLLHGDLWGGNWSAVEGQAVIYDPAVYYGDRETDLAMTRLFGGFSEEFYAAYDDSWPLHDGYEHRIALYQLYHVLNHLNLFGAGYLNRAISLTNALSAI
jgi:protein-ribulosamine 3-kinase